VECARGRINPNFVIDAGGSSWSAASSRRLVCAATSRAVESGAKSPHSKEIHFFVFFARFRSGNTSRQISHVIPSQPRAVQCSRP
jgi:hypothetical protein